MYLGIPRQEISSIQLEAITAISPKVMKNINQKKLEFFTKEQILRMNSKTRRIYILRIQLKNSLDTSQISRRHASRVTYCIVNLFFEMVTLIVF